MSCPGRLSRASSTWSGCSWRRTLVSPRSSSPVEGTSVQSSKVIRVICEASCRDYPRQGIASSTAYAHRAPDHRKITNKSDTENGQSDPSIGCSRQLFAPHFSRREGGPNAKGYRRRIRDVEQSLERNTREQRPIAIHTPTADGLHPRGMSPGDEAH